MTNENQTIGAGNLPPEDQAVVDAANACLAALQADSNYCASVGQSGSAVNTAVHNFKAAFNAVYTDTPLPIGTGNYEPVVAAALSQELGGISVPPGCSANPPPPPPQQCPPGQVLDASGNCVPAAPLATTGMPQWLKVLLGVIAAAAVVFAGVMIYRGSKKKGSHSAGEAPRRHKKRRRKARRKSKRR